MEPTTRAVALAIDVAGAALRVQTGLLSFAGFRAAAGVLKRAGHTEAAVDLARLAGRAPAGAQIEFPAGPDSTSAVQLIDPRTVRIVLTTHATGGISDADIALAEGVRFFVTALGNPRWVVDAVHAVAAIAALAWSQAGNVRDFYAFTSRASLRGLDAVSAELHPGEVVVSSASWMPRRLPRCRESASQVTG